DFDPHFCDLIIKRQFGDCKDQSVLLSSLYNQIGFRAYPVLVATRDYPSNGKIRPWPAVFDHVAVSLEADGNDFILDPSGSHSIGSEIPSNLRGKPYLVADGHSVLSRFPSGPRPSNGLIWSFAFDSPVGNEIGIDFELKYYNNAKEIYQHIIDEETRLTGALETFFREAEWHVSSIEIKRIVNSQDTLSIAGNLLIDSGDLVSPEGLSVGSPILVYLLDIFPGVRSGDYCRGESYILDESVRIKSPRKGISIPGHHEVWVLDGLEFSDELSLEEESLVYRRVFSFDGGRIPRDDYNAFRDFILSMRNQRYVRSGE
ncbi:MAG: hypothetical protein V3W18_06250, partial [candidate division Zixibacteria bacterium]